MKASLNISRMNEPHPGINIPNYEVDKLKCGILHIGVGNFHRAHQAYYTDLAIENSGGDWGVCGVSLNTRDMLDKLSAQDGLYTLQMRDFEKTEWHIIGCLRKLLFLGDSKENILKQISASETKIISLTITEKGYAKDQKAIGLIAEGLFQRYLNNQRPITVLSCDNLQSNGEVLQKLIHEHINANNNETEFLAWLKSKVSFPNSMVDRIVPKMSDADIRELNAELPYSDACALNTEIFGQWIIEDKFVNERPAWDKVGVAFVQDVKPYEQMKLRLLNASHSYMAYMGSLKSFTYVSEAIADDEIMQDIQNLFSNELIRSVDVPDGFSVQAYTQALIQRFRNPNIKHKLLQIAMDGSAKIPQRWLPGLEYNLSANLPVDTLCKAVAAWLTFVKMAAAGKWSLEDPMSTVVLNAVKAETDPVNMLSNLKQIFPEQMLMHPSLQVCIREEYKKMSERFLNG